MRFENKVALVTGSSSGIGEDTARLFAAEGARVVVNSATSVAAGEAVAASLPGAIYVRADISDPADCARLIDSTIETFGRLDVLVNNGGAHDIGSAPLTDEVFAHIFDVIVIGTHRLTELAAVHLRAAGDGSVVNVTSLAGLRSAGASIPYAVSKAALNHLTVVLADTYAPAIRVNAVAPGLIRTPWTAGWDALHEQVGNTAPLQRSGESIEVARVILDVAASTYVTGQVISVDGGMSIR
jgi:ketoreductase RED2